MFFCLSKGGAIVNSAVALSDDWKKPKVNAFHCHAIHGFPTPDTYTGVRRVQTIASWYLWLYLAVCQWLRGSPAELSWVHSPGCILQDPSSPGHGNSERVHKTSLSTWSVVRATLVAYPVPLSTSPVSLFSSIKKCALFLKWPSEPALLSRCPLIHIHFGNGNRLPWAVLLLSSQKGSCLHLHSGSQVNFSHRISSGRAWEWGRATVWPDDGWVRGNMYEHPQDYMGFW